MMTATRCGHRCAMLKREVALAESRNCEPRVPHGPFTRAWGRQLMGNTALLHPSWGESDAGTHAPARRGNREGEPCP